MLEPVTLHQTRFHAPGLFPDARGVAMGPKGAVMFPSLDGLVGWFRVLSDEVTLDDLLPSLVIHEARGAAASLLFVVVFQAETSYLLDRAARAASLLGGLTFTGSSRHFVKYRDAASPLGYDVDAVLGDDADLILYADRFTQPVRLLRQVPFAQLVFRLSPRRIPGPAAREARERTVLWAQVVPGLGAPLLGYLFRNRVEMAAMLVDREGGASAFGDGVRRSRFLLVRIRDLPLRILELLESVPGVSLFRPVLDNVLVEVGYRHPLNLEATRSVFDAERLYLFAGEAQPGLRAGDGVEVVAAPRQGGAVQLVDGEKLVAVGFDLGSAQDAEAAVTGRVAAAPPEARVDLRLVPSGSPPRRVTGALLPWSDAGKLRKLVFALPPPVLAGCRAAALDAGLLLLAGGGGALDTVPLGEPLYEVAPRILVPLGWEFLPRVDDAVLADRVGGTDGRVVVFRRGAARPMAVALESFEPLGRRLLARIDPDVAEESERLVPGPDPTPPTVVNDPAGLFPLWGYRDR